MQKLRGASYSLEEVASNTVTYAVLFVLMSLILRVTDDNRASRAQNLLVSYAESPPIKAKKRLHSNPRQVELIYYTTIPSKPPFKCAKCIVPCLLSVFII